MTMGLGLFIIGIVMLVFWFIKTTPPASWRTGDSLITLLIILILVVAFILGYWHAIGLGFVVTYGR